MRALHRWQLGLLVTLSLLATLAVPATSLGRVPPGDPPNPGKATPTFSAQASPDVALGGSIKDTATLGGGDAPTGSILFEAYGPDDPGCDGLPAFTDTVTVTGAATYESASFTPTASGTYRWFAHYSGDSDNNSRTSNCDAANHSVHVGATTTGLTSSANPALIDDVVTFTATVTPSVGATSTPTGEIQFFINGAPSGAAVTLANGQAQLIRSFPTRGFRNVRAVYSGDTNFAGSSATVRQAVSRHATAVGVTVSPNPGARGNEFTFDATVTPAPPSTAAPGSAVHFYIDGIPVGNWRKVIGGHARFTSRLRLAPGTHDVTAKYRGGGRHLPSISPVYELTIN